MFSFHHRGDKQRDIKRKDRLMFDNRKDGEMKETRGDNGGRGAGGMWKMIKEENCNHCAAEGPDVF